MVWEDGGREAPSYPIVVTFRFHAKILAKLANQDHLSLAFCGDDLTHRYTKTVRHDEQQWQYLNDLVLAATEYIDSIPVDHCDFDLAKAMFILCWSDIPCCASGHTSTRET